MKALVILALLIVEAGIVYFINIQQKEKSSETHSPMPSRAHVETSHKSETERRTVISKNSESPTQN